MLATALGAGTVALRHGAYNPLGKELCHLQNDQSYLNSSPLTPPKNQASNHNALSYNC